jgi:nitrate/nitrite transporter NarK
VALVFMVAVPFKPFKTAGRSPDMAWRMAMLVPAALFDVTAVCLKLFCWDTPTARRFTVQATGKTTRPSMWDYVEVLEGFRVVIMIFQYSACFGTGLAMNNRQAVHFRVYFLMEAVDAAALAASFGAVSFACGKKCRDDAACASSGMNSQAAQQLR